MTRSASSLLSPSLWLASFICALYPLNEYQLLLMGGSVVLLLIWMYERLANALKQGVSVPRTAMVAVMAGLWALSFASLIWTEVPWISVMGVFFMGALPVTFLTLAIHPYTPAEWKAAFGGVAVVMGILGLWAIIQFVFFYDYFFGRAVHPLKDPNSLAALFNLALFCVLGWMSCAPNRRQQIVALVLALILAGGLIATGSRGGFFAFLGAMGLIAFFCRDAIGQYKRLWLSFVVGVAILFAASVLLPTTQETMANRVAITLGMQDGAVGGDRALIMRTAWQVVQDHWLLGTGVSTFALYYPEYRHPQQVDLITHAHNDPLQMWAETGIVAPILFYTFLILAIIATTRRAKLLNNEPQARWKLLFPFVSLGILAAHSHINLNLYNLSILMMTGLVTAYWFAQLGVARRPVHIAAGKIAQATLAVVFAIPIILYSCVIASDAYMGLAQRAIFRGDIADYGEKLLTANALAFQQNPGVFMMAVHVPTTLLYQRRDMLNDEEVMQEVNQINNNLDRALRLNPRLGAAWYFKGLLAQIAPKDQWPDTLVEPAQAFETTLKLDPIHIGARLALINMAFEKQDFKTAGEWAKPALNIYLYNAAAKELYQRSMLIFTLENDPEYREKAQRALADYLYREVITIWRQNNPPWKADRDSTFPQKDDMGAE